MKKVILIGHGKFGKILAEKLAPLNTLTVATRDYPEKLAGSEWAVVATPVATHAAIVRDCLEANLNVFCEKPLSENPDEVAELIELAKTKNKKLYVDDVFLWREEFKRIWALKLSPKKILLRMMKYGTFNDSLLAAHVYHDLYIVCNLTQCAPLADLKIIKAASPLEAGRIDVLEFSFKAGETLAEGSYDRTQEVKQKIITIDERIVWKDNSLTIDGAPQNLTVHDALSEMLGFVLSEKVNFDYNNKLALEATRLLARIKDHIA